MRSFARSGVAVCLFAAFATSGEAATIRVNAGGDLQRALNTAQPGDVILLQAGASFVGNFTLPVKSGATFITIRSSALDSELPAPGVRIGPSFAAKLPKLRSPNSAAALRTAPGAHHWRVECVEFGPNSDGLGDLMQIGDGSLAQNSMAMVPTNIVVDRVYLHGNPGAAQKRGIALNGAYITIQNSFLSEFKAANADAQAIAGWNGPGPYTIENNFLEGAAENFLLGGSDPGIPGLVTSNVTFRRNLLSKQVAWRSTIIPTPTGLTAAPSGAGGLPGGPVGYLVIARRPVGMQTMGRSTAAWTQATAATAGALRLQWNRVSGAVDYQVFGRGYMWTVTTNTFTDTGTAGTPANAPTGEGTKWTVKNLFELKNARAVVVQYNIFETNWQGGQAGYAIVFTPRNSGGKCPWCTIENVEFSYNIVRHSAAGINILGHDSPEVSGVATDIRIRQNLFYDINQTAWGGNGWFLQIGDGPRYVLVDHNTIDHTGSSLVYVYGGTQTSPAVVTGFQFTNNMARHNTYGISGSFFAYGLGILNAFFPGATFAGNFLSGGTASKYPAGNYFTGDFDAQFAQLRTDYRLVSTSMAFGRATDGTNLGADIATIVAQTQQVGSGERLPTNPPAAPGRLRLTSR